MSHNIEYMKNRNTDRARSFFFPPAACCTRYIVLPCFRTGAGQGCGIIYFSVSSIVALVWSLSPISLVSVWLTVHSLPVGANWRVHRGADAQ